jgi:hypothetical protein
MKTTKYTEMKQYNFDEIIPTSGTNCIKYDAREWMFKTSDVLPLVGGRHRFQNA